MTVVLVVDGRVNRVNKTNAKELAHVADRGGSQSRVRGERLKRILDAWAIGEEVGDAGAPFHPFVGRPELPVHSSARSRPLVLRKRRERSSQHVGS